jgi:GTP-binding protein EngB required for normal cell division
MNENELWRQVCEQENIALIDQYLQQFPFGLHVKEAKDKQLILKSCNTIDMRFLKQYVQKGIVSLQGLMSAGLNQQKIDTILQTLGINEEQLYTNAIAQQTTAAMGEYLKYFPSGAHAEELRQMKERIEDAPWFEACQANTREAYQAYQQQHPDRHTSDVRDRLAAIEAAEILAKQMEEIKRQQEEERKKEEMLRQQDEADWTTACQTFDFQTYLNRHPKGKHADEAIAKKESASILMNLRVDPNAYYAGDLKDYVTRNIISGDDLFRIFGPQKTDAIMNFNTPSQLPEGMPPIELAKNTTEVYFWGTPSSGKTCALGALISSAGRRGILEKLPCSGYDYMTRLGNIFNSRGVCTFPYSTSVETIQEMMMRLLDADGKNHSVTLVDMAGELFRSVYFKRHGLFLDQSKESTLGMAMKYLRDTRNKKMHFFVVEYGAHDNEWEGLRMKDYLSDMMGFLEFEQVFKKSTVGVYVLVTKCDKIPAPREERPRLAYEYVEQQLNEFWGPLQRVCSRTGVADLKVLSYSVGDVFAQKLCLFDPRDTEKVIEKLLVHTPAIGGWSEWLKG